MDSRKLTAHQPLARVNIARDIDELTEFRSILIDCISEAQNELAGVASFVCWDWDMIRSYMFHDKPAALYGEAMVALLALDTPKNKIVVLDGARKEMLRYLQEKARYYKIRRLHHTASSRPDAILPPAHSTWSREWMSIDVLADHRSIQRLASFLSSKAVTLEDAFPGREALSPAAARHTEAYRATQLAFQARSGELRNRADALNMAQLASARHQGLFGRLVTGTSQLLVTFPSVTADPVKAYVSYAVQREVPNPRLRSTLLNQWLGTVTQMIAACSTILATLDGSTGALKPRRLRTLAALREKFRPDKRLRTLSTILSNAARSVRQRRQQLEISTEPIAGEGAEIHFRRIEAEYLSALDSVLQRSGKGLHDLGRTWRAEKLARDYERWRLTNADSADEEVLTIEVSADIYSVHWPVIRTLFESCDDIQRVAQELMATSHASWTVDCLLRELKLTSSQYTKPRLRRLGDAVRNLIQSGELKRLRVKLSSDLVIFYEGGDATTAPRLAVVANDSSFRWVIALLRETHSEIIPEGMIRNELERRLTKSEVFGGLKERLKTATA